MSTNYGLQTQTIEREHHEIHEGEHFYVCRFSTIAGDASELFVVQTSADTDKLAHMVFSINGTSQTELSIRSDASVTSGTAITAQNSLRNSSNTTAHTILGNPTIVSSGTEIYSASGGLAGSNPSRADTVGFVDRSRELILAPATTYIFRVTSRDDDNIVNRCAEWYEDGV